MDRRKTESCSKTLPYQQLPWRNVLKKEVALTVVAMETWIEEKTGSFSKALPY